MHVVESSYITNQERGGKGGANGYGRGVSWQGEGGEGGRE